MAIYTSNYSRKGDDPGAIAISAKPPTYYTGNQLKGLAPTWDFLKPYQDGIITKEEYTERYIAILEGHVDVEWYEWLDALPDPTYFLCFESPGKFCHRRLFAEWVENKCGWVIPEWKDAEEVEKDRQSKMVDTLFTF